MRKSLLILAALTAVKFYKWNTQEGFDNDVLDDEWMVQLLVNISWAFGR